MSKTLLRLLIVVGALTLGLVAASSAQAFTSPHEGSFTTTTDACAGCHRAHTAGAAKLLANTSQTALCTSCHDGTGADTNVVGGVYLGTTAGTQNAGLRGGGFTNAKMDTNADGTLASAAVTSKHTTGVAGTAFGSGAISGTANAGENVTLQCGQCHNPHGNSYYRMLRPKPTALAGWSSLTAVNVTAETTKNYTIGYTAGFIRDLGGYPAGTLALVSDWCGQCHTRYNASTGSGSTSSTDALFAFRHTTDGLTGECFKCHVAHGTSATMGTNSTAVAWPASTGSINGDASRSALLHLDNRGVCIQCHASFSN